MATCTGVSGHIGMVAIAHRAARERYREAVAESLGCPVARVLSTPATWAASKAVVRAQVGAAVKSDLWVDGEPAGSVETILMIDDDRDLCIATAIQEPTDGVA